MRYTKEFKLECIRKYKNGEHIPDPGGCKHKTFHDILLHWVKIYDKLGETGLDHNKPELSLNDKLLLIQRVIYGEPIKSVAISVGRQADLISKWYKLYLHKGIDGLKSSKKGRPPKMKSKKLKVENTSIEDLSLVEQNKALKKRLEEIELENEYLKKLAALVQARKDQQQKKK